MLTADELAGTRYALAHQGDFHQRAKGQRDWSRMLCLGRHPEARIVLPAWRRLLGPAALQVYHRLRMIRDRATGCVIVTAQQLVTGGHATSKTAALRAMKRLLDLGIIERTRAFAQKGLGTWNGKRVTTRFFEVRVYGGRDVDGAVLVPFHVWQRAQQVKAMGRGGARPGAGAPRGNRNWEGSPATAEARAAARKQRAADRERLIFEQSTLDHRGIAALEAARWCTEQEDRRREERLEADLAAERSLCVSEVETIKVAAISATSTIKAAREANQSGALNKISSLEDKKKEPLAEDGGGGSDLSFPDREDGDFVAILLDGLSNGTAPKPRAQRGDKLPGLPRFPLFDLPQVPPPPLVDPTLTREDAARLLARLFSGCVQARTGKPCWILKPALAHRSKYWPVLLAAVDLMREHNIEPARWISWSFGVWADMKGRVGLPAPNWLFAAKRLESKGVRGWFNREAAALGATVQFGDPWRTFHRRWRAMTRGIDERGDHTEAAITRAVCEAFPEGWSHAANGVAFEMETKRRELRARVQRGEWVWG